MLKIKATFLSKAFLFKTVLFSIFFMCSSITTYSDTLPKKQAPAVTAEHNQQASEKNANDNEHTKDLNDVQPFPFIWLVPEIATLGSSNAEDCDAISAKAKFTITGYFSPTCGHCGIFFNTAIADIQRKYVNKGKIKFGFRPYCHHVIDFIVCQIASCRGADQFYKLFSLFMQNQAAWFAYLLIPEKNDDDKKKAVEALLATLPETIDIKKALITLNINEKNPASSVLIFALSQGFTIEEIDAATNPNSLKAQEVTDQLIVGTLAAKTDKGESVPGIPSFYINDVYQDDPLTIEDFENILKTGKIVERKKEPTQTAIPSNAKTTAAGEAFTAIKTQ